MRFSQSVNDDRADRGEAVASSRLCGSASGVTQARGWGWAWGRGEPGGGEGCGGRGSCRAWGPGGGFEVGGDGPRRGTARGARAVTGAPRWSSCPLELEMQGTMRCDPFNPQFRRLGYEFSRSPESIISTSLRQ